MPNKAPAILALAILGAFLAILLVSVPRFDLGLVIVVVFGMAVYDLLFYRQKRNGD